MPDLVGIQHRMGWRLLKKHGVRIEEERIGNMRVVHLWAWWPGTSAFLSVLYAGRRIRQAHHIYAGMAIHVNVVDTQLLALPLVAAQRFQTCLIPLSNHPQGVLLLDIRHGLPVRDAAHCAIDGDHHGPQVIQPDRGAAVTHIQNRGCAV
jgi:hypothetical protein